MSFAPDPPQSESWWEAIQRNVAVLAYTISGGNATLSAGSSAIQTGQKTASAVGGAISDTVDEATAGLNHAITAVEIIGVAVIIVGAVYLAHEAAKAGKVLA